MPSTSSPKKSRSRSASPKRTEKPEKPNRVSLAEFIDANVIPQHDGNVGEKYSEHKVLGALGPQGLPWSSWEDVLDSWLEDHSIAWDDMTYADVLGFFITRGLQLHYGSYEAQVLFNQLTILRLLGCDRELERIFTRLNELKVFAHIRKETARKFSDKLAHHTTTCLPWVAWTSEGFRMTYHSLDDPLDREMAKYVAGVDSRFVLKTD